MNLFKTRRRIFLGGWLALLLADFRLITKRSSGLRVRRSLPLIPAFMVTST